MNKVFWQVLAIAAAFSGAWAFQVQRQHDSRVEAGVTHMAEALDALAMREQAPLPVNVQVTVEEARPRLAAPKARALALAKRPRPSVGARTGAKDGDGGLIDEILVGN